MRKNKRDFLNSCFTILTLDDDPIMTATLQAYFQIAGYRIDVENDPYKAIERVKNGSYDILLLDFLMNPICGDQVVEQIRKFDSDIFIILLTGHKSLAPPIKTIRELDIQGYYEKSDRFDQLELLVESCVKSIKQLRTIQGYQDSTSALIESMPQIYSLANIDKIGENILNMVTGLLPCEGAYLMLDLQKGNKEGAEFTFGKAVPGATNNTLDTSSPQFSANILHAKFCDELGNLIGYLAVSLVSEPTLYQTQLFQLFAKQSEAALKNTKLLSNINESYLDMIQVMRQMVDAKDIYTRGHSDRVSLLSYRLAKALGKDDEFCNRVKIAGLFHDVGKMGIPDNILISDRALTTEEYEKIKQHPLLSSNILSVVSKFKDIAKIARQHHERLDGKGYPDSITGALICEEARIVSITDAFDAMITTRRYRPSLTVEKAVEQLKINKGTQFDGHIVDVFIKMLNDWDKLVLELEFCDIK